MEEPTANDTCPGLHLHRDVAAGMVMILQQWRARFVGKFRSKCANAQKQGLL
jgi:hypothetical protein